MSVSLEDQRTFPTLRQTRGLVASPRFALSGSSTGAAQRRRRQVHAKYPPTPQHGIFGILARALLLTATCRKSAGQPTRRPARPHPTGPLKKGAVSRVNRPRSAEIRSQLPTAQCTRSCSAKTWAAMIWKHMMAITRLPLLFLVAAL